MILNSHTQGEHLDNPKFWPIFEACEALGVPAYLHPNSPPKAMIAPFLEAGLDGAIYGFGVETGLHLLRIITAGVFDRFPGLRIVVGHCGEALPFWLYRIDYMHRATIASARYPFMKPLQRKPSDYLRENVYVTNSGVAWEPAIMFCRSVLGADRVMYAMDYPYQFVREEVLASDRLPLTVAEKKEYFQGNAERVFGLRGLSPTGIVPEHRRYKGDSPLRRQPHYGCTIRASMTAQRPSLRTASSASRRAGTTSSGREIVLANAPPAAAAMPA